LGDVKGDPKVKTVKCIVNKVSTFKWIAKQNYDSMRFTITCSNYGSTEKLFTPSLTEVAFIRLMKAYGKLSYVNDSECYANGEIVDTCPVLSSKPVNYTETQKIVVFPASFSSFFGFTSPDLSRMRCDLSTCIKKGNIFDCNIVLVPYSFDRFHWVVYLYERLATEIHIYVVDTLSGFVRPDAKKEIGNKIACFLGSKGQTMILNDFNTMGKGLILYKEDYPGVETQSDGIVCGYAAMDLIAKNIGGELPLKLWDKSIPPVEVIAKNILKSLCTRCIIWFKGKKNVL
jgi:hypothetical protein